ncbi:MAG: polyphosphate polymerase domain-containing protein [Lachnospiraceae bacterium]|nr:polyphosphate polymerase domain-containing protein [Lachnospiraceae bacterium]
MGEYREVFQRTEIKYLLKKDQYDGLMEYLLTIAKVDAYGISRINNIYYDTEDYRLIRTSMEKPLYKEKLRLRTYGDTKDDTNAFVEIKKKYDGIVYKRRMSGNYKKLHDYLAGNGAEFGTTQIAKEIKAFREFYGELYPAMSICYDRIAMAGIEDPDFRVTFDSKIEWNAECTDLRRITEGHPLLAPEQKLMEIKVANAFPLELSRKLSELNIFPTSFSKYGAGYADMIRRERERIRERSENTGRPIQTIFRKGEAAYVE